VRDAFDLMMVRIQKAPPRRICAAGFREDGRAGREVILGMTRDPQFGRC